MDRLVKCQRVVHRLRPMRGDDRGGIRARQFRERCRQKILVLAHHDRRPGAFAVHRPRAVKRDGMFVFAKIIEGYHTLPAPGV